MISLGRSLIAALGGKNITVKRASADGDYVNGVFIPQESITTTIFGSIQPLGMKETVSLPEGDRTRMRLKVYSSDKALISREIQLKVADILIIDCEEFEVEAVEKWPDFYKVQVAKVNITGEEG